MSDDAPKKFTTSDYTVLNEHFNQALARDNEIVRARRAKTFWANAKSISLILFFLGIAAMFIGKAMQLSKVEKVIERTVEVENLTNNNQHRQEEKITIDGEELSIQKNVIHFNQIEVTYKGIEYNVMTRHNFHDPRDERPHMQSCYITGPIALMIDISTKTGTNPVTNISTFNSSHIAILGLTTSDISYFRKYCKYI